MPDFTLVNHGTIYLLTPVTPQARTWVADHLDIEGWQRWGRGIAVDHHYVIDIVRHIQADDLSVA